MRVTAKSKNQISDDLVARSLKGDRDAREILAASCLRRIWRMAYLACGGGSEVEDLVQMSMVQILTDMKAYRGPDKFSAWVDRVTVRMISKHFRRSRLKALITTTDAVDEFTALDEILPDTRTEGRRMLRKLAEAITTIRPKNRMALILSIVQHYPAAKIAATVGCSEEAAKKRLLRGRSDLVKKMKKDPYCRQMIKEMGL